jgi:hypothetical protein
VPLVLSSTERAAVVARIRAMRPTPPRIVLLGDSGAELVRASAYERSYIPDYLATAPFNSRFEFEVSRARNGQIEVRPVDGTGGDAWDWNDGDPRPPWAARLAGREAIVVLDEEPGSRRDDDEVRAWWLADREARARSLAAGQALYRAVLAEWAAETGGDRYPEDRARALEILCGLAVSRGIPVAGRTVGEIAAEFDPRDFYGERMRGIRVPADFE